MRKKIADFEVMAMPDPMLMNAFNNVNLAAACIVTSAGFARDLGVAEEKWVYPLGGAGTRDSYDCELQTFPNPPFVFALCVWHLLLCLKDVPGGNTDHK